MVTNPSSSIKHAIVTGATGIVGIPLCEELVRRGINVTAVSRTVRSIADLDGVDHVQADVTDFESLRSVASNCDVIFHVAAAVHGSASTYEQFHAANVVGTENAVRLAEVMGAKLVYVSSVNVAGYKNGQLRDDYARTKSEAEDSVLNATNAGGVNAVVVRPATVFGNKPGRAGLLVDRLLNGSLRVLPVPLRNISPVWSGDLAKAMVAAAENSATGKIYTVAGPTVATGDFVNEVAEAAEISRPITSIPGWILVVLIQIAWWLRPVTRTTPPLSVESIRSHSIHDGALASEELGFDYTPIHKIFGRDSNPSGN